MKGRERNAAFFQNSGGGGLVSDVVVVANSGPPPRGGRVGMGGAPATTSSNNNSGSIQVQLRRARTSGSLVIMDRKLPSIPPAVFLVESAIDEDEKFWEIQPVVRVDLSNNEITTVPADIANLSNMTSFKIRHNKISDISTALFNCSNITVLDFSNNKLSAIPVEIGRLELLTECNFAGNSVSELPPTLANCSRLQLLDVSENQIERLPEIFGRLGQLTKLRLGLNRLSKLPGSINDLGMLQELIVNKNRLDFLPALDGLTSLVFLDATDNKIAAYPILPPSGSSKLARLYLGNNSIVRIDERALLCGDASLVELDVQGNRISDLPLDMARMGNLKALNAANNDLTDVPYTLGYMSTLQRIQLEGNPIRTIRRTLLTQSPSDLKAYLRTRGPEPPYIRAQEAQFHFADDVNELDARFREMSGGVLNASGLELNSLSRDFVTKLYRGHSLESDDTSLRLVHLNLSNNHFSVIPPEIMEISTLQVLDMSANRLGDTPPNDLFLDDGCFPVSLRYLEISKNRLDDFGVNVILTRVPISVPRTANDANAHARSGHSRQVPHKSAPVAIVPGLQSLICRENRLTEVPKLLSRQTHSLRELQISFNQIRELDRTDFSEFKALEIFDASNNKLVSLGNVASAVNLTDLLVANNDLSEIPAEISLLKKLRNVSIMGNPQKTVRLNIVQQGTDAILKFLKNRLPEGAEAVVPRPFSSPAAAAPSVMEESAYASEGRGHARHDQQQVRETSTASSATRTGSSMSRYSNEHEANRISSASSGHHQSAVAARAHSSSFAQPRTAITTGMSQNRHDHSSYGESSIPPASRAVDRIAAARLLPGSSSAASVSVAVGHSDADMQDLEAQIERMKNELEFSGISEAKRFAVKKEMAKARANLLRLQRAVDAGV